MLVFNEAKHIAPMLNASLFGQCSKSGTIKGAYATEQMIENYGYAFTLILGSKQLGYAVFFKVGASVSVAVEFSDYDSMLFGETYDEIGRDFKKRKFVEFCHKNGIKDIITEYFLELLERIAVGEKVAFPGLSGSDIACELQTLIFKARAIILTLDETNIHKALAGLHAQFEGVDEQYPFGYSAKPFTNMGKTFGKRLKRFMAYESFLTYLSDCNIQLHRKIENEILEDMIKEQTITNDILL